MKDLYRKLIIREDQTAKQALDLINKLAVPRVSLFISDGDNKVKGVVSEGDIRRGLLGNKTLDQPVSGFMITNFHFLRKNENNFNKYKTCLEKKIRFVPLLDKDGTLVEIIDTDSMRAMIPAVAILMAGGKGERLKPYTDEIPKPLLEIGGQPVMDYNIQNLAKYGIEDFFFTVKHMGEKIKSHVNKKFSDTHTVQFIEEDEPRGTAGSLSELKSIAYDFIVMMNSDLLTNIDFGALFEKMQNAGADMVIATVPYSVDVPYAVLELSEDDQILSLVEKPRYTYYSNAGIYLIKKDVLKFVPDHGKFDATDLIEKLISEGKKVVSLPVMGYWLDIGRPEDFHKAQHDIKYIQF